MKMLVEAVHPFCRGNSDQMANGLRDIVPSMIQAVQVRVLSACTHMEYKRLFWESFASSEDRDVCPIMLISLHGGCRDLKRRPVPPRSS